MNESRIGKRLLTLIQGESPTDATGRRGFLTAVTAGVMGAGARILGAQQRSQARQPPAGDTFPYRPNWGRWGANDSKGAVNLITPEKIREAAGLVKTGRAVSLSRPYAPEQQYVRINDRRATTGASSIIDYYGSNYHGVNVTHVDALSHVWDRAGMWNGRDPDKELDTFGPHFADIAAFSSGLITRGVLLDVPRYRQAPFVTVAEPVRGEELEAIAKDQNVTIRPGDALLVYSGREAFAREAGAPYGPASAQRPGLHQSCAKFVRDTDVAVLCWDMHDAMPDPQGLAWPMHRVLYRYGVPLVDNALLEPLAKACLEEKRQEFMFVALPLNIPRGTGSPANPIALF